MVTEGLGKQQTDGNQVVPAGGLRGRTVTVRGINTSSLAADQQMIKITREM